MWRRVLSENRPDAKGGLVNVAGKWDCVRGPSVWMHGMEALEGDVNRICGAVWWVFFTVGGIFCLF